MHNRVLGLTGIEVNAVGFGGIPIQRVDQDRVNEMIDEMIKRGINFIDTARAYTVSEQFIGNALKNGKRDHFVLATKSPAKDYEGMKSDIEKSLIALNTQFIDIYQCHLIKDIDQYAQVMSENGAYRALLEAKAEGKIKHIGITAHSVDFMMQVVDDMPFETLQFPYNLVEKQGEPLFEKAKKRGIGVIIMKPIAGGAIDNGELSIKFILQNPNISVVIPGMDSVEQVRANVEVGNTLVDLTDDEKIEINELSASLGETFCRRCGYCLPCVQGIDIPTQFIIEGYLTRYNLVEWAIERYKGLAVNASACIQCGECEPKCPYNLPIRQMLKNVVNQFDGK